MTERAYNDDGTPINTWKPPTREEILCRTPKELVDFMAFFAGTYAEAVAMTGPDSDFTAARKQCMVDVFDAVVWHLSTCRTADSADDAPQLTDADMDRGQWKIGGKPVDAETGKAAMREALIRRRCYCSDGAFCVIESGQTLAAMFYCGRKSSKPNHQASDHR